MTTNKAPAVAEARALLQAWQREAQETEQVRGATGETRHGIRVVRRSLCLRRWKGEGP
jgi:hypothetical protein